MAEESYRAMLRELAGVASSTEIDLAGFAAVMERFKTLGFVSCKGAYPPHMRRHLTEYAAFGEAELSSRIADDAKARAALLDAQANPVFQAVDLAILGGVFPLHLRSHLVGFASSAGESALAEYIAGTAAAKVAHDVTGAGQAGIAPAL
jgi:hypothetical protein